MPEYLSPGVYVEEVDTGPKPIEGVSTSTAGFIGMTKRGRVSGLPELVTSMADFQRRFGGYFDFGSAFGVGFNMLPYAVNGFFTNGGKRAYIMRVPGAGASIATTVAQGGLVTRLSADTSADPTKLKVLRTATLRGIQVGTKLRLRLVKNGTSTDSPVLTVTAINRSSGEITVDVNVSGVTGTTVDTIFEARYTTVFSDVNGLDAAGVVTNLATPTTTPRPATFTINAKNEGSWGRDLLIQAFHDSPAARSQIDAFVGGGVDNNRIRLKSGAGVYPLAWVEIDRGQQKIYRKVKAVDGLVLTLFGPAMAAVDVAAQLAAPDNVTVVSTCEFRLALTYVEGLVQITEQYGGLTLEKVPGRYYIDRVNAASRLISFPDPNAPALTDTHPFLFPSGGDGARVLLDTNGSDGTGQPNDQAYVGTDPGPGQRTGLKALEDIDQVSIIAAPGITSQTVQSALIEQCERLMDRFAILDPAPLAGNTAPDLPDIQTQRQNFDTKYAAIYYPRLIVPDVLDVTNTKDIAIPPSGHMAGIYARVDNERGVHKAPANEVVRGIKGFELKINKGEQDILNPSPLNINVLRDFREQGRGLRVWGARVITSDPSWRYINVRRLFIFVEESIDEGTQWVVFEPNDYRLWARVRQSVTNFLTRVWRDGALFGATQEEAFFVKCDDTTMTQDDLDNGRLIMVIGIAPVKPAEFVIIRIGQKLAGAEVEEL
jgi:phage tail sheath protein FI